MRKYYIIFIIFIILASISLPVRVEGKSDNKYYSYSTRKKSKSHFTFGKSKSRKSHGHYNLSCGSLTGTIICLVIIILLRQHFFGSRK